MINATATYSTAQTANDPRIPIGISREGSRLRVAADTLSNPVYGKNTTAAASHDAAPSESSPLS